MSLDWLAWDNPVSFWWVFLACTATLNICVWMWSRIYLVGKHDSKTIRTMLLLSSLYVFGCAFRSYLPRADVQRICLFDTWFSTVLVGRTVATIAELAFVAQWALVMKVISQEMVDGTRKLVAKRISQMIVPIIFVAECFSWYAVIRTHYMGNTFEESLWAVTYTLIMVGLVSIRSSFKEPLRLTIDGAIVGCILYVFFMVTVDVPMYVTRWMADSATGKPLLGLVDGLHDLATRWVVTHDITEWRTEIPWMSLYFSLAVWTSLALCYFPLTRQRLREKMVS